MPAKIPLSFKTTDTNCFEVVSHKTSGRGYAHLLRNRKSKQAHRHIWEECFGFIPEGMCVCHHCDNPKCINPEHLFLGTIADNNRDRYLKGRYALGGPGGLRGEKSASAKLTRTIVREVRRRYQPFDPINGTRALAREFGVSHPSIRAAISGKTWRWLS